MKRVGQVVFILVLGCSNRASSDVEMQEPSELELLCSDWCDTQRTCGFAGDYDPQGECLPNCMSSRGWDVAWESGCDDETRAVLSCLSTSTCEELAPTFDPLLAGPPTCVEQLGAILTCSS